MRKIVADTLYRSGALKALDMYWGANRLTVLAYHRVAAVTSDFDHYRPNVSATPEAFAQQIEYVAKHFSVIDLDTLRRSLDTGAPLPPRPLLITFDDGYMDNYTNALPVLRRFKLPAVIFLMTSRMDDPRLPWWDEGAYYFHHTQATSLNLPEIGTHELSSPELRHMAEETVMRHLKLLPDAQQRALLDSLADALQVAPPPQKPYFVSWAQVRELIAAGISCQPHTVKHPRLSAIDYAAAETEIRRSREQIEAVGQEAFAFAYPFGLTGDYNTETLAALHANAISTAFTLSPGPVLLNEARQYRLEIPRILVQYRNSFRVFLAKVMGIHTFRSNRTYIQETINDARVRR